MQYELYQLAVGKLSSKAKLAKYTSEAGWVNKILPECVSFYFVYVTGSDFGVRWGRPELLERKIWVGIHDIYLIYVSSLSHACACVRVQKARAKTWMAVFLLVSLFMTSEARVAPKSHKQCSDPRDSEVPWSPPYVTPPQTCRRPLSRLSGE